MKTYLKLSNLSQILLVDVLIPGTYTARHPLALLDLCEDANYWDIEILLLFSDHLNR